MQIVVFESPGKVRSTPRPIKEYEKDQVKG